MGRGPLLVRSCWDRLKRRSSPADAPVESDAFAASPWGIDHAGLRRPCCSLSKGLLSVTPPLGARPTLCWRKDRRLLQLTPGEDGSQGQHDPAKPAEKLVARE
jgi:hypothetical protein